MKILIPKSSLSISLIAPLALQWATNMGDHPEDLADYIKNEVLGCLVHVYKHDSLPIKVWEAVAQFTQDLIHHFGGENTVVVKLDDQPSYYLLRASFGILGNSHRYNMPIRINKNGQPPE
jgi:hypothetical protein